MADEWGLKKTSAHLLDVISQMHEKNLQPVCIV